MREQVVVQAVVTSLMDEGPGRFADCGHLTSG